MLASRLLLVESDVNSTDSVPAVLSNSAGAVKSGLVDPVTLRKCEDLKLDAGVCNHSNPTGEMGGRDRGILVQRASPYAASQPPRSQPLYSQSAPMQPAPMQPVSPYAAENKEERIRKAF